MPLATADVATVMPDFYSEPGLHPFRDQFNANVTEHIDPFTGGLNLAYVDLVVPGNGGLDIKIQRYYSSNNVYVSRAQMGLVGNTPPHPSVLQRRTPVGLGWSMHFGRVVKARQNPDFGPCHTSAFDDTTNNPVLELPDGRKEILFVNATSAIDALFITKSQWVAYCLPASAGLLVISPEGMKYTMDYRVSGRGYPVTDINQRIFAWHTTRIEDRNGNYVAIDYYTERSGTHALIRQITSSDGRLVSFTYADRTTDPSTARLTSITANGQTWRYDYAHLEYRHYLLKKVYVSGAAGSTWQYDYYPDGSTGIANNNLLKKVTYPYGGTVTYAYDYACFEDPRHGCRRVYNTFYSIVVDTKTNGGRDVTAGTWRYSYNPSTTEDITTVTFPGGKHVYKHFGSQIIFGTPTIRDADVWKVGLLKEKLTYDGSSLINREIYTWDRLFKLSNEEYVRPPYDGVNAPRYKDTYVYAPVLIKKEIIRDGTTYTTTYSNFDASYNPRTIVETGQATKTRTLTYFPRVSNQNIVSLIEDESLGTSNNLKILRTFDPEANLKQIIRYGVQEDYTYHPTGDLYTNKNARGKLWRYQNYYRGIPRSESHPELVSITRTVNASGTIASERNGRGYTTRYTYDDLNRVESIRPPIGSNISINWTSTGRSVTRGTYAQTTTFDGFARPSDITAEGITVDIDYNALGYKSFESYPGLTTGTSTTTDTLGRVTKISHADGTSRTMAYLSGNQVRTTNERAKVTTHTYRSYGDPDEQELMRIDAPESVSTVFNRNILGQMTSVIQGGVSRSYTYYGTNNYLRYIDEPETGRTTFGRDAVGNMTSRKVGSSSTTAYTYDDLNRLDTINYPLGMPDVSFTYDKNDNVETVDNGISKWTYTYDSNDNLETETLTVNAQSFRIEYDYTGLDYLTTITYPSNTLVAYDPDDLGRPTQVGAYVSGIDYHPNGQPKTIRYANGRITSTTLNNRQWIETIDTTGSLVDLTYDNYDGGGNVGKIVDGINRTTRTLGYDGLDRLTSAAGPWGTGSVSYDAAGNIKRKNIGGFNLSYNYTSNRLRSVSGGKAYSFGYDAYGNVSSNSYHLFDYDDAANLREVRTAANVLVATYDYDGNNRRVHRQQDGKDSYFIYAKNGDLMAEYGGDGRFKEYAYLAGKLIAMRAADPNNLPPVADAGPDQSVDEDTPVSLDGGASSDPNSDVITYDWSQSAGPAVTLAGANTAAPSFTVPWVVGETLLTFTLTVTDEYGDSASDTVNITVRMVDTDADGLSDAWEIEHFGDLAQGPNDDPDRDGLTNLEEFLQGSDPTLPSAPPGMPSSITVVYDRGTDTISWGAATGMVSHYELVELTWPPYYWAPVSRLIYSGPGFSFIHTRCTGFLCYFYGYRVRACNGTACSDYLSAGESKP